MFGPGTVPSCRAWRGVDRHDTLPDGTVLDSLDSWFEINEVRTLERTVVAYLPGRLDIAVVSGRSAPFPQDEYLNEIDPDRATTRLPDGSTVTRAANPCNGGSAYFSITLPTTRQIIISTTPIGGSTVPVTLEQIEYLATAPELDLG